MASFNGITLNGVLMPDFCRVVGIENSILPPVSQNLLTIAGKAGAYDYGNELGVREINIDIKIVLDEENTLPQKLEQLADWLYYDEAKELVLGDDTAHYYMAKFTGDSNIKEDFLVGEGTLTFICTKPFKYGSEKSFLIPSTYGNGSEPFNVTNTGNYEAVPKIHLEITRDVPALSIIAGDEFIDLGTPYGVDDDRAISDHGDFAMRDLLTTTNGWTNSTSVIAGTVQGTFEVVDGQAFRQASLDYGTGTTWHGATMQKALDYSVQDFEAEFTFRFTTDNEKIGRMNMSLCDANGVEVFQMQIFDSSQYQSAINFVTWCYAGAEQVKATSYNFGSAYTDFEGYVKLRRVGITVNVEVGITDGKGGYKVVYADKFVDYQSKYQTPIAQAKLHVGAYGTYTPATMEQRDIFITKLDKESLVNAVPLILRAGDVLDIDNETGAILKNGQPFYQYLNPASSFIKLQKGANGISILPADSFENGTVTYTERSL